MAKNLVWHLFVLLLSIGVVNAASVSTNCFPLSCRIYSLYETSEISESGYLFDTLHIHLDIENSNPNITKSLYKNSVEIIIQQDDMFPTINDSIILLDARLGPDWNAQFLNQSTQRYYHPLGSNHSPLPLIYTKMQDSRSHKLVIALPSTMEESHEFINDIYLEVHYRSSKPVLRVVEKFEVIPGLFYVPHYIMLPSMRSYTWANENIQRDIILPKNIRIFSFPENLEPVILQDNRLAYRVSVSGADSTIYFGQIIFVNSNTEEFWKPLKWAVLSALAGFGILIIYERTKKKEKNEKSWGGSMDMADDKSFYGVANRNFDTITRQEILDIYSSQQSISWSNVGILLAFVLPLLVLFSQAVWDFQAKGDFFATVGALLGLLVIAGLFLLRFPQIVVRNQKYAEQLMELYEKKLREESNKKQISRSPVARTRK